MHLTNAPHFFTVLESLHHTSHQLQARVLRVSRYRTSPWRNMQDGGRDCRGSVMIVCMNQIFYSQIIHSIHVASYKTCKSPTFTRSKTSTTCNIPYMTVHGSYEYWNQVLGWLIIFSCVNLKFSQQGGAPSSYESGETTPFSVGWNNTSYPSIGPFIGVISLLKVGFEEFDSTSFENPNLNISRPDLGIAILWKKISWANVEQWKKPRLVVWYSMTNYPII